MKNLRLVLAAGLIAGVWAFSSCQKDQMNTGSQSDDITTATDEALMDHQSTYVDNVAQEVTEGAPYASQRDASSSLSPCATVTYDTSGITKTVTISFGSAPCLVPQLNEYRQGTLVITYSGNMRDSGTIKTIIPENYFVGDSISQMNQFSFTKTIVNQGENSKGNIYFATTMQNAKLSLWNGKFITWNGNHDWEWVQGEATPNRDDDVFMITGGHTGVDRNGEPFTAEITKALEKDACQWVVSGTKIVTHGSNPTRTIDYGDGTCDDTATVTLSNGKTKTITIGR